MESKNKVKTKIKTKKFAVRGRGIEAFAIKRTALNKIHPCLLGRGDVIFEYF